MKKILRILAILFIVIIAALIIIPMIYKDELLEKTRKTLSEELDADVQFEDFGVGLFSSFPDLRISLEKLYVSGSGDYKSDTLVYMEALSTDINLLSVIRGKSIVVKSVAVNKPYIHLIADDQGNANWNLGSSEDQTEVDEAVEPESAGSGFGVNLKKVELSEGLLIYTAPSMKLTASGLSGEIKGGAGEGMVFDVAVDLESLTYKQGSDSYYENVPLGLSGRVSLQEGGEIVDLENTNITFNGYPLSTSGSIDMRNDRLLIDLGFNASGVPVADAINLVPTMYASYFEGIDLKGTHTFDGVVKGVYEGDNYPEIMAKIGIVDGAVNTSKGEALVTNFKLDGSCQKPQGALDLSRIVVDRFSGAMTGGSFDVKMSLDQLISDPRFDFLFNGRINLGAFSAMVDSTMELSGIVDGRLAAQGSMLLVDQKAYDKIKTDGEIALKEFRLVHQEMPQVLKISDARLLIKPEILQLNNVNGAIGSNNFAFTGQVTNLYPYLLKDGVLNGSFLFTSAYINFNELLVAKRGVAEEKSPEGEGTGDEVKAFTVPDRMNVELMVDIKKLLYDKLSITDAQGKLLLASRELLLKKCGMNLLKGGMVLDGVYSTQEKGNPRFAFNVDMENIDIPSAYQSLTMFRKMVPIAAKSVGAFSTSLKMNGTVSDSMNIILPSINGVGTFSSQGVKIMDSNTFAKIASVIKSDRLKNVEVKDFTANYTIENGNLIIEPFPTSIGKQDVLVYGKKGMDDTVDMKMDIKLDRKVIKDDLNKLFGVLPGSENIKFIDATVVIEGTVKKPKVKLDLSKAEKQIRNEMKKKTLDDIKDAAKKLKNIFK